MLEIFTNIYIILFLIVTRRAYNLVYITTAYTLMVFNWYIYECTNKFGLNYTHPVNIRIPQWKRNWIC